MTKITNLDIFPAFIHYSTFFLNLTSELSHQPLTSRPTMMPIASRRPWHIQQPSTTTKVLPARNRTLTLPLQTHIHPHATYVRMDPRAMRDCPTLPSRPGTTYHSPASWWCTAYLLVPTFSSNRCFDRFGTRQCAPCDRCLRFHLVFLLVHGTW